MTRNRILPLTALILSLAVLALAPAAAAAQDAAPKPPQPLVGRESYRSNCAPCHGETGGGDGPSASGLGVTPAAFADYEKIAARSLSELFDLTLNGNMQNMMPPWKDRLTDQEIWDTVAYAWTLHTTSQEVEQGKQIYEANCASCHGADGRGAQAGTSNLADFAATSAISQAAWAQVVAGGRGAMPGFAGKLGEADQRAALEYVRGLSMAGPLFRGPLAKGTGVISGTVTNGTTGQALAGVTVELGIFDQSTLVEQRTAPTDAAGLYRFAELPTDSALAYAVRAEYPAGIPYSSDFASFEEGKQGIDLPLSVYETTSDPGGIRASRVHFIIEFDAGQALVAELMVFSLDGNRAYVGDSAGVLRFPLPAGSQDLAISDSELGGRFERTADGFVDRLALPPGEGVRQVLYRYALPFTGGALDLLRTLPYPTDNLNALVSDVGQQVTSPELTDGGVRETQGGAYFNLLGQDLPAGQQVTIRMTRLPSAAGASAGSAGTGSGTTSRGLLFVLIGLAAAVAAALVALPLLQHGRSSAVRAAVDREGLLDALERLEAAYEAGELPEAAYRDQRLRLKAQLLDALPAEEGLS